MGLGSVGVVHLGCVTMVRVTRTPQSRRTAAAALAARLVSMIFHDNDLFHNIVIDHVVIVIVAVKITLWYRWLLQLLWLVLFVKKIPWFCFGYLFGKVQRLCVL